MKKGLLPVMAWVCVVCPVCIVRRRWPQGRVGRAASALERGCLFCRAHAALYGGHIKRHGVKNNDKPYAS